MVQVRQDQVDAETQANLVGLVVPEKMHKHSNKHKLSVNARAEQQRLKAQQQHEERRNENQRLAQQEANKSAVVEENNSKIEEHRLQAEY